jgi:hypothetical protein
MNDVIKLQFDLDNIFMWCRKNDLCLNLKKCSTINFSMKKTTSILNYSLADISLLRVSIVNDLGVWFDVKLSFNDHVYFIRNKAFAKLGFLKRTCANFRDEFALKTLYQPIVRSHFDYALLIWHPYLKTSIQSLKKIKNNFIRFLCF